MKKYFFVLPLTIFIVSFFTSLSADTAETAPQKKINGIWLPSEEPLFQPLIADPRGLSFSLGIRFDDEIVSDHLMAVSMGEELPIFRWNDINNDGGKLQVGLSAGIWAIFDSQANDNDIIELINTDYSIGIPLTYSQGNWSHRLNFYHTSSHLGDEYLAANPTTQRLNPSFEAVDLFSSCQLTPEIRLYGGLGYIMRDDSSFRLHPLYVAYGFELKLLGREDHYNNLLWQPFFAVHVQQKEDLGWNFDGTFRLGYEWRSLDKHNQRSTRLFLELHDGYSLDGQFAKEPSSSVSLALSMGY
jgi:hypothetical protein